MTTENKAKAYDEAIKKAKEIKEKIVYSHLSTESCKAVSEYIDTIIPELCESEDEKIREDIMEAVENWHPYERVEEIRAYLEKQKKPNARQRLAEWSKTEEGKAKYEEVAKEMREEMDEEKEPMYNLAIPAGDVAPAEEDGPFDEDEFLENELSAFLQDYDTEYDDDAVLSDVARHFYEIGKKQQEQNPEERFEEAREKYQVEWSEEDEKQLDDIISIIRGAYEHGITISETRHRNAYFWLNNLRPSWKPSEEQMKILYGILVCCRGTWEKGTVTAMESLYQDLKKLM